MKRPVLVTVIGIIGIVGGVAQTVFGAILVGLRNDEKFLADADIKSSAATAIAITCIIVGLLTVLFAIGLLKGNRVARGLLGVSEVAQAGLGVYGLVALDASRRASSIGSIVGALVVLYFLFGTDKAKAFFAKH
jgi:hypothetical protein